MIRKLAKKFLRSFAPTIAPNSTELLIQGLSFEDQEIMARAQGFTMTSPERIVSLIDATRYLVDNRIEGDIVECGVWRGGSMMIVAEILKRHDDTARELYLYDTFEGMTDPGEVDVQFDGVPAELLYHTEIKKVGAWCYASYEEVSSNLKKTRYPASKFKLVKGKVEKTIPAVIPSQIALLRLDTDWYESTLHELEHLYPRLVTGGVMIIDDYGHWRGAKAATDEYFSRMSSRPFMHRIDYTGRLIIKPLDRASPGQN